MTMARTEVGSAYVSIYPDTSHFSDELANELGSSKTVRAMTSAGETASNGFSSGFSAVTVALGNIMANAAIEVARLFTDNLNRGIERLDTIANFPKLMQTFGYSTEEAGAAVVAIQQHLDGLPGSTDEVLRLVQAISDSTGDLTLATTAGLAFNDMLTAAGADAYTSMMSMRMFDQMMGGAQFTSMRWQALVSKMPLQFNLLAQSMLGPTASAQDLGQALADGEVTMTDVAEAMTALGPRFTEQARAMSYGVGTAMRNFGNRMAAGVAGILGSIGQERIAKVIDRISYGIRDAMLAVGEGIGWLVQKIDESGLRYLLDNLFTNMQSTLEKVDLEPLKSAAEAIIGLVKGGLQWLVDNSPAIESFFLAVTGFVGDVLQWIIDNGDVVNFVLGAIGGALAVITAIQFAGWISGVAGAVGLFLTSLNPITVLITLIASLVGGLVAWFTTTEEGKQAWADFTSTVAEKFAEFKEKFSTIIETVKRNWEKLTTKLSSLWNTFKTNLTRTLGNIKTTFTNIWNKIRAVVVPIIEKIGSGIEKVWKRVQTVTSTVFNAIKTFLSNIWNGIKSIIEGVVKFITSLVKGDFEGMKKAISNIFGGIATVASTIWNGIKTTISGVVDGIKSVASSAWNSMKTTASNVWNGIKTVASTVWNGIKTTISGVTDGIKTVASGAWNSVKTTASTIWNGIKTTAGTIWGGIKSAITAPIESAKKVVGDALGAMQGFINGLTGKTVTVSVNTSGAQTAVADINSQIKRLTDKTLYVNVQKTGISGIDINAKAAGGGWYMTTYAAGGIATRATAGIFGEAGDEALVPLSNRNKVRPFARAVAYEINDGTTNSNVTITGNSFYIRSDNDIQRLAQELSNYQNRQMAGRL